MKYIIDFFVALIGTYITFVILYVMAEKSYIIFSDEYIVTMLQNISRILVFVILGIFIFLKKKGIVNTIFVTSSILEGAIIAVIAHVLVSISFSFLDGGINGVNSWISHNINWWENRILFLVIIFSMTFISYEIINSIYNNFKKNKVLSSEKSDIYLKK